MAGQELKPLRHLVIADASPLIALSLVGHLPILESLFGKVLVSPLVIKEVLTGHFERGEDDIRAAFESGWLVVCEAQEAAITLSGLDPGETQSILQAVTLMREGADVLLLMDEKAGRSAATEFNLACMGTAAVIAVAKRQGLIASATALFEELFKREFRLSQAVIREVLAGTGERLEPRK
jgi:predicted nucleic acid-binding protein